MSECFGSVLFRRLVFLYQLGLGVAGVGVATLSLYMLISSPILAISPKSLLVGGLVVGVLLMIVTTLGALGSLRPARNAMVVIYLLLMFGLVGVTITGLSITGTFAKNDAVRDYLEELWDTADTNTVLQIETWGQCCGFMSYVDRIQEPCTKYEEEVGCYEPMRKQYEGQLDAAILPTVGLLMGECAGLVLCIMILLAGWREKRQAKLIGDRQPFDAWHKAVFQ